MTKRRRFEVLSRDSFRCRYCGAEPGEAGLHVDHVRPRADGGLDDLDNLVAACVDCNQGKGARLLPPRGTMLGKFFHTRRAGKADFEPENQGRVSAIASDGYVLVQLYSWWSGDPNGEELWPISKLIGARFYDSDAEMRAEYERTWAA